MLETWVISRNLSNLRYLLKCAIFCCSTSKKYYFTNERKCFIRVSKHEKIDESTRRKVKCFDCFLVFGSPDETLCTSFEMASY